MDGILAIEFAALLLTGMVITGYDFVIEDRTRRLSPTERLKHGLLTLIYGVFLTWLAPSPLWQWSFRPVGLAFHDYGTISIVLSLYSVGVLLLGVANFTSSKLLAMHQPKSTT